MSNAERSRRRREKAKALREAAPTPDVIAIQANGSKPVAAITTRPSAEVFPGHDYPRMLYHPDGRTTIAATPEQHEALRPAGWGTNPLAKHLQRPVWHHGIPLR